MKIGIISDLHLGYARFEEDSYTQAEEMLKDLSQKVNVILVAGDVFDSRIPKLETIRRAIEIFKKSKKRVIAIHGNHERRTKGFDNPLNILASSEALEYIDMKTIVIEENGEKVAITGIGSVPEEQAQETVKQFLEKQQLPADAFNILLIHQNITEIVNQTGLTLEFLESLPFALIINGHIHKRYEKLNGKLIVPGSTVITQLKKEETEPKGYIIYDTSTRKAEFFPANTRRFIYEEINFDKASEKNIVEAVEAKVRELRANAPGAIIAIKLVGTLREGLKTSDIRLRIDDPLVFISNELNAVSISEKIEEIKKLRERSTSIREFGRMRLEERLKGKIRNINATEFLEKLIEDEETAEEYVNKIIEKIIDDLEQKK